ncbi:ABC transporter ATP-binding protein [Profundibacter amoris]|uniref:ABC transporter ATP-binding protein n=1 Tax=Profundibacter amoris TaxID=2171755 RepID=A0A347UEI5_9RHOB|nr:ABC transporter ATP-binding protein [Profundibacter amoris]AXX97263.1 ABC transporter ATP-binding protein [Profundibacter amoris]
MIELDNVSKVYNEGRVNEVFALRDITLQIRADQTTVLKGPSGSGKTTLLTLIGCLSRPTVGRIHLEGKMVSGLPEKFMTEIRREKFGFVFQRFNLVRGLTVLENVMLPAYPLGLKYSTLRDNAERLLGDVEIADKAGMKVENLSGGEAQRVAIARALINNPDYVIADEPTANLDTRLVGEFLKIVEKLRTEGKSVIITSHDPRIWQADVVDRVIGMEDGRVIDDGIAAT